MLSDLLTSVSYIRKSYVSSDKSPLVEDSGKLTSRKAVADRLRRALHAHRAASEVGEKELTWEQLGEAAGVSARVMSDIKNAKRPVSIEECGAFAAVLGIPAQWLAFAEGETPPGLATIQLTASATLTTTAGPVSESAPAPAEPETPYETEPGAPLLTHGSRARRVAEDRIDRVEPPSSPPPSRRTPPDQ